MTLMVTKSNSKFTPWKTFTSDTKNDIFHYFHNLVPSWFSRFNALGNRVAISGGYVKLKDDGYVYFYVTEKQRRKVKRTAKGTVVIRRGHWVTRIYRFPVAMMVSGIQKSRTFKVELI